MGLSSPMALNAAFFQEVTMFQPMRPFVKWSKVENRFALSMQSASVSVPGLIGEDQSHPPSASYLQQERWFK
jgi:hypothetical protein